MNFPRAVEAMMAGKLVRRASWPPQMMYVGMAQGDEQTAPLMRLDMCLGKGGQIVEWGYACLSSDWIAEDWIVVGEPGPRAH